MAVRTSSAITSDSKWNSAPPPRDQLFEIVGVVADLPTRSNEDRAAPAMYLGFTHNFWPIAHIIARTKADPAKSFASIRSAVAQVDPAHAIELAQTLEQLLEQRNQVPRLAWMISYFAISALLLAAVGIYGFVNNANNAVWSRAREIALRMALGADSGHVIAATMRWILFPALAGIGGGLAVALVFNAIRSSLALRCRSL